MNTFAPDVYERLAIEPVRGEGAELVLADGRRIIDFYGGHAVVLFGHDRPEFRDALAKQASNLLFQTNLVSSRERDDVERRLVRFAPAGLDRCFLVNSGAEANENALRASFLHHARSGRPRTRVVAVAGGFHGRTAAASSLVASARDRWFAFPRTPFDTAFVPFDDAAAIHELVDDQTAAMIVEPVQGIAGARALSAEFLRAARDGCNRVGAHLIVDEVQCGLGRSGTRFAIEAAGVRADLATLGKGLAGGFPAAAVLMSESVAGALGRGDLGTTFGGAPLACAMIAATLDLLESGHADRVEEVSAAIRARCLVGSITEISGRGLLLGLRTELGGRILRDALLDRGILVGTSSDPDVVRLTPPFEITEAHIDALARALEEIR